MQFYHYNSVNNTHYRIGESWISGSHDGSQGEELFSLVELVAEQAAQKREAEKIRKDREVGDKINALLENAETTEAAHQMLESIYDLDLQEKARKICDAKIAESERQRDLQRAQIVTGVVAGELCVNLVRGKPCIRPAELDPYFGDMCKQCFRNKERLATSKLSDVEKHAEKLRRKERKRERDAEVAKEKESYIQREQAKRKRRRALKLKAPNASPTAASPAAAAATTTTGLLPMSPLQVEKANEQILFQADRRSQDNQSSGGSVPQVHLQPQQPQNQPVVESADPMDVDSSDDCFGLDPFDPNLEDEMEKLAQEYDYEYDSNDLENMDEGEGEGEEEPDLSFL